MQEIQDNICTIVCDYFKVDKESLCEPTKLTSNAYNARYFIWYILHCDHYMSISNISKAFNRSRNTVFRGIANVRDGLVLQSYYRNKLAEIYELIEKGREDC